MNEQVGDSKISSSAAQHRLMLQRLQHSQLQNALIRHKTQRFLALKLLRRSVELRRQLSHAQTAASSGAGGFARPTPAPPLDPGVKALIEKLTEIADILPRYSDDELGQPKQRTLRKRGDRTSEQQRAVAGFPSEEHATEGKASLAATTTTGGSTSESVSLGHPGNRSHKEAEDDSMGGEETQAAVGGSPGLSAPSNEDYTDPEEEDDLILNQQLRELDSNMNTMFQDLEKKVAKMDGSKEPESSKEEEDAEKKVKQEHRQKERAALVAQLEGLSRDGLTRRPKWRWIAEGIDDPDPDRVLKGKHLWKAATLLIVVFYVRPKRALMQRKARWDKTKLSKNTTRYHTVRTVCRKSRFGGLMCVWEQYRVHTSTRVPTHQYYLDTG